MNRERILDQPAFLLHSVPYRETSLVLDLFTREHGRVAAVAKGAKRPRSALRAVLLQFQPLSVTYTGRGELRTLTGAEWIGGLEAPRGYSLLCAFYLNELLIRLLAREDAHPALFDGYQAALAGLSASAPVEEVLRRFEWLMLREAGYAPDLRRDAENRAITSDGHYQWLPASGFLATEPGESAVVGQTLLDIAEHRYSSEGSRQQAKYLTRRILNHYLDGVALNTRRILQDLQRL